MCYLHNVYTLILHFFKNNPDIRKRTDVSVVSYLMHRLHKIIFLKLKQCSKCIFLCAIRLSTEICYYFVWDWALNHFVVVSKSFLSRLETCRSRNDLLVRSSLFCRHPFQRWFDKLDRRRTSCWFGWVSWLRLKAHSHSPNWFKTSRTVF